MTPLQATTAFPAPSPTGPAFTGTPNPSDWIISEQTINGAGRAVTNAIQECVDKLHIRQVVSYQPINRYWLFEIYETAIFIGLAILLAGFFVWLVRHRLA